MRPPTAKRHLADAQNRQQQYADRHRQESSFEVFDQVLSTANTPVAKGPAYKFKPRWTGPFPIISIVNPVSYELQLPATWRKHNVFHVSLLKRYQPPAERAGSSPPAPQPLPPPIDAPDPDQTFIVDRILSSREDKTGAREYLIQWVGFPDSDAKWEPFSSLIEAAQIEAKTFWERKRRRKR